MKNNRYLLSLLNSHKALILTLFAACCYPFGTSSSLSKDIDFEREETHHLVTMPGIPPLLVTTTFTGYSPEGWLPTSIKKKKRTGNNGNEYLIAFKDYMGELTGNELLFKRSRNQNENKLSCSDEWSTKESIDGFIRTEITIPYETLTGITISNGENEVTAAELTETGEVKTFIAAKSVDKFKLSNAAGSELTLSFSTAGKFDVITYPNMSKIEIRLYWTKPGEYLKDGSMDWEIEVNAPSDQGKNFR